MCHLAWHWDGQTWPSISGQCGQRCLSPHGTEISVIYWAMKFLPIIHFDVGTSTGIGMLSPITHKMNSHHKYGLLLIMGYILGLMCGLVFHWALPMWLIELIYAKIHFMCYGGQHMGCMCCSALCYVRPIWPKVFHLCWHWWIHYINQWYVYTIGT